MSKFHSFYKNNRIYFILMIISAFCLLLVVGAFVVYFIEQNSTNVYGDRLNGIENIEISDETLDTAKSAIEANDIVDSATVHVQGKIIYVDVYLKSGSVDDAQSIAIKSLDSFSEDELAFYDVSFGFALTGDTDDSNSGFPVMGYKKSDATIISWTKTSD